MTIEEFLDFTDTRPQEERWELIEGVPVMNPSPIGHHQMIVTNISGLLWRFKTERNSSWFPIIGTGTRVPASEHSLPQPDIMVLERPPTDSPVSEEALVLFEVLSRSNTRADQAWRRQVYASVPNCQHFVTVSLKAVEVVAYDRDIRWKGRCLSHLADTLALPALDLTIPVADVYRWTPLSAP
ncbi:MAG TPA: Uma2 family endonuclease [Hyphomicrobiaceae bacterium]